MPVKSLTRIGVWTWVPPDYYPVWKVTITRGDGTIDDITNYILDGEINNGATTVIGSFRLMIINSHGGFTGIWSGNEVVRFYADYADTATTLRFQGRIERVYQGSNNIYVNGRSEAISALGITVTKQYNNQETSTIITNLVSSYLTGFTTANVSISTTSVTLNWYQKPFWDCITELCKSAGFDCYIDANKDFHYFESGSIINTNEAAVHDANILETGEFGYDYSQVKNRVIVYGQNIEGLPLVKTAQDINSYNDLGRWQEEIINDTNITTMTQAQERADNELTYLKTPPIVGKIRTIGLPTIAPGEKIRISDPQNGINPGTYIIQEFSHKITNGDILKTELTVEKSSINIPQLFKSRIEGEQKMANIDNPYEMKYSYNDNFTTDSGSHSSTAISSGYLKSTGSSGIWISTTHTTPGTVSGFQLKATGEDLANITYYVSVDNGITYQTVTRDANITPISTGSQMKVKFEFSSASAKIDSFAVLYKV